MKFLKQNGFTLIELMISIALVSILASIAYPSYTQYAVKANRAAAQSEMMEIASRQQQFLLTNRAYVDKTNLEASGYTLPADVSDKYGYAIVLGSGAIPFYTLTFTPIGLQTGDGDLVLDSNGVRMPIDVW
jgi:type IV pilus assembly protein PilE